MVRKVTGSVSAGEFIASFEGTLGHPDFRPDSKSLLDFSEYDHQLDSGDMRKISGFFLASVDEVRSVRTAIVVAQAASYEMVRMLQAGTSTLCVHAPV